MLAKKAVIVLGFKTTRHLEEGVVPLFGQVIANFSLLREVVVEDHAMTTLSQAQIPRPAETLLKTNSMQQ